MERVVNQACVRNQAPICDALTPWLDKAGTLLEIGSGTGQHGTYIAQRLPHINWQLSETPKNLPLSTLWCHEAQLSNLLPCIPIDVFDPSWGCDKGAFNYGYCANVLHFISEQGVKALFTGMSKALTPSGVLFCYGPINENGFTSEGNLNLDMWVKQDINPQAGIKELSVLQQLAASSGFILKQRINLPSNNVLLIWVKQES